MGDGPKPIADTLNPAPDRERSNTINKVLSQKAVKRSAMLKESSASRIENSKKLLSQSDQRRAKPHITTDAC